ncbi:maltotransferase domain-containing protein, partial [Streptomyces sp. NPDC047000]|uniref:maltotransferase domain-containing protein n=1 Tax=Streptomyces sp. NPDC047000 TaxID=3155474 RepID=UPI0033C1253A
MPATHHSSAPSTSSASPPTSDPTSDPTDGTTGAPADGTTGETTGETTKDRSGKTSGTTSGKSSGGRTGKRPSAKAGAKSGAKPGAKSGARSATKSGGRSDRATATGGAPGTSLPDAPDAPDAPGTPVATAVGRIPVLDVEPVVQHGRRPAKAVTGETFQVSATVFREGHDAVAANAVLTGPDGCPGPWTPMRELAPGTDRWGADVTPDRTGRWTFHVEAWSDPVTTWRHHARIKVPAGIDTELVLEEGARLLERAAEGVPAPEGQEGPEAQEGPEGREAVLAAVAGLRDGSQPAATRLAAALTPEVDAVLARYPLRELVTASEPLP